MMYVLIENAALGFIAVAGLFLFGGYREIVPKIIGSLFILIVFTVMAGLVVSSPENMAQSKGTVFSMLIVFVPFGLIFAMLKSRRYRQEKALLKNVRIEPTITSL